MELQTLIDKLIDSRPLVRNLERRLGSIYSNNLLGYVKQRVQKTGINALGVPFRPYSTRPALLGYSEYPLNKKAYTRLKSQAKKRGQRDKSLSKRGVGGVTAESNWVSVYNPKLNRYVSLLIVNGGYRQIRQTAGYQVAHKDFDISNAMWSSVKVLRTRINGSIITFGYGSTKPGEIKKILGHNKREGINILEPSKQELEKVQTDLVADIEKYVMEIFNA